MFMELAEDSGVVGQGLAALGQVHQGVDGGVAGDVPAGRLADRGPSHSAATGV